MSSTPIHVLQARPASVCIPTTVSAISVVALLSLAAFSAACIGHTTGVWVLTGSVATIATAGAAAWLPLICIGSVLAVAIVAAHYCFPALWPQKEAEVLPEHSGSATGAIPSLQDASATKAVTQVPPRLDLLCGFVEVPTWENLVALSDSFGKEGLLELGIEPLLAFTFDDWRKEWPTHEDWTLVAKAIVNRYSRHPCCDSDLMRQFGDLVYNSETEGYELIQFLESTSWRMPPEVLVIQSFDSLRNLGPAVKLPSHYLFGVQERMARCAGITLPDAQQHASNRKRGEDQSDPDPDVDTQIQIHIGEQLAQIELELAEELDLALREDRKDHPWESDSDDSSAVLDEQNRRYEADCADLSD